MPDWHIVRGVEAGAFIALLVLGLVATYVGFRVVPPMMLFVFRRMTSDIAKCPQCGAIIGPDMKRAVPRTIGYWTVNLTGGILIVSSWLPCLIGVVIVSGDAHEKYSTPMWWVPAFVLGFAMLLGGMKLVSGALRYPISKCTLCGFKLER